MSIVVTIEPPSDMLGCTRPERAPPVGRVAALSLPRGITSGRITFACGPFVAQRTLAAVKALRDDQPKVFIIYETDPSGEVPQSLRRLDAILTELGWEVGTDYRYQHEINGGNEHGVPWALALWGILPLNNVAILLRATDRAKRSREYRGVDWELETLALHHHPVLTYDANLLENLSDADAHEIGSEIHHDLLVAMVFGGCGLQLPGANAEPAG